MENEKRTCINWDKIKRSQKISRDRQYSLKENDLEQFDEDLRRKHRAKDDYK